MDLPSPCPVCGAYSLPAAERTTTLLAVCDVLTLKALEALGKYIVRAEGARYRVMTVNGYPLVVAHTLWVPSERMVDKALRGAWDVVPAIVRSHGPSDVDTQDVVCTLDEYVHDLAITGTGHCVDELGYRFETRLGIPAREAAWT